MINKKGRRRAKDQLEGRNVLLWSSTMTMAPSILACLAGVRSSIKRREGGREDDEYFSCFVAVVIALSLSLSLSLSFSSSQSCHVFPVVELTGCKGLYPWNYWFESFAFYCNHDDGEFLNFQ